MPGYSRSQTLQIDCADQLATVTLNRPQVLNAANPHEPGARRLAGGGNAQHGNRGS
jgi:hypothetical protein